MTVRKFQASFGFKLQSVAGRRELVLSPHRFGAFQFSKLAIAELKTAGILIGEKGNASRNDTKRIVRCDIFGERIKERVFVINVDKLRSVKQNEFRTIK